MMNIRLSTGGPALALGALLLSACTAAEQTTETSAPSATPTQVRTDADRRAIYNGNGAGSSSAVPDATPNRVRLGEQAADINREKRIETLNTNDPNTTTPETRMQRLNNDPPVDNPRRP
ncbi:hypothetical protein IC235_01360 [Hymenobacter sp. BT664]|uniref:Lipoprotein n=1 Tax=Hymenobacter montanus TaxID=2771359 RepID=A0A927B9E4_9BACT|nr:hypothetical protein [Hymenobacter montanus]MBD2766536.1 hypothetical protein [Hymenobacter montanus]